MLYFNADPRDGMPSGGVCNTCCCEALFLRPGETNLMQINYAPWSVPIGGDGIVPTLDWAVQASNTCSTSSINGFPPPVTSTQYPFTALNTPVITDPSISVLPMGNTFTFAIVPLVGPYNGTVEQIGPTAFRYTPNPGYTGVDWYWILTTDAQGRTFRSAVIIDVNSAAYTIPFQVTTVVPFIDRSKVVTNQRTQTVRFPIYMPVTCRDCDFFKMTIRQPARDCDGTVYDHFSCFDIRCRDCG